MSKWHILGWIFWALSTASCILKDSEGSLFFFTKSVFQFAWWKKIESVQSLSPTLCNPMDCSTPGLPVHYHLLKFAQTHVHWVGDAIEPSHPLLPSSSLPSIFPSIRVFSSESVLPIMWPTYWSFSFSVSPSNEQLGLVSFRMDWLDLFAVQGTLKSLLQHHSSEASILQCSAFFIVQLWHPYMTTEKTTALTRQTFAD